MTADEIDDARQSALDCACLADTALRCLRLMRDRIDWRTGPEDERLWALTEGACLAVSSAVDSMREVHTSLSRTGPAQETGTGASQVHPESTGPQGKGNPNPEGEAPARPSDAGGSGT